jgi:Tol biopolymer transport system component
VAADPGRRERFEREAQVVAVLNHPNIVTIHSIEEADGLHFLTMELVEGETLDKLIQEHDLPLARILAIAIPMADAISAAHQRGIVHRDLKPANVMVGAEGRVKVLDFGLAKLKLEALGGAGLASLPTEQLTGEGRIVGTVAYMSPEQAEGKAVDHRTDIFSLGVVLYEMATGERPFKGETALSVLSSIMKDTPKSVTELNPAVPRDLARIVRHCLVKDPDHRYQSAKDLRNELEELKQEVDSGELAKAETMRAVRRAGWTRWLVGALSVVGLAAITGGYLAVRSAREATRPAATPPEAKFTRLTSQPDLELFPSLSPDGKWVVYAGRLPTFGYDVYLQSVGGENAINLTKDSPAADYQPTFSPDGELIAFRSEREGGGIFVMGRTGESVRRLADVGFNPTWSPDGREIAFASEVVVTDPYSRQTGSFLWAVSIASGERRQVTETDAVQPSWSPHGHRIAYWRVFRGSKAGYRDIWTIAAAGGQPVPVTDDPAVDWNPMWSPDGRYLYFASDRGGSMNLWRVAIDEVSGTVLGQPQPVTTPSPFVAHMSFSADGSRMAFASVPRLSNVQRVQFDAPAGRVRGEPQSVTSGSRHWTFPALSPDGAWIAVRLAFGVEDLFIIRTDGTGLRQLTNDPYFDRQPRWSPDGKRIAFYSNRGGNYEVWVINPDGSGLRQLSDYRSTLTYPIWSPDGSRIAFVDQNAAKTLVFDPRRAWGAQTPEVLPPIGPDRSALSTYGSWSPDGRHIAGAETARAAGPRPGVLVYHLDSRTYERLTDFGAWPSWVGDSRRLVFTAAGKLVLIDSQTRKSYEILSVPGEPLVYPIVSRDNRWLYFVRQKTESDIWLATFSPAAATPGARR